MNILLTGSSGFLGGIILGNLKNESNKIITLNRSDACYKIDLSTSVPLFKEEIDLVIHAAGKAHEVPVSELESVQFLNNNVTGTKNLLKGLEITGMPSRFVFISSVSVYGLESGCGIDETFDLKAVNPYGKSKIDTELIILDWCKKNNIICTILRLPLLVGSNPPGNLGSMINAIKKGFYFNVGGGTARKSMVLATDISKFVLRAAEVGGIYNLTDGCHPNFFELSHHISKQLHKWFVPNLPFFLAKLLALLGDKLSPLFPINSDKLIKITSTLIFNDSKARKAFGWNPTPVLVGFKIYK